MLRKFRRKKQLSRQRLKSRQDELIILNNPKSPVAEAYRSIRTNLSFISPDKPLETVIVTSTAAAEGKSLTLANLAISLAQNGKKVIIIDADLRKPMQHKFFELTNFGGLSNILTNEIDFAEALRETEVEGVKVITTGIIPPNPAELLASRKMEEVIQQAQKEADIVLIDTPPVLAVTDAAVLGHKVDGVILVVASHQTHSQMLLKAKETLDRAQAHLLGTVLNMYPADKVGGYYSYYYYYGEKA